MFPPPRCKCSRTRRARDLVIESAPQVGLITYEIRLTARDAPYIIDMAYSGEDSADNARASWCEPADFFARCFETLAVAVTPPADANTGETIDLTLHAVKADDDNVRSLIRLLATVDDSQDHPDESSQVDDIDKSLRDKDAPALPSPGLI